MRNGTLVIVIAVLLAATLVLVFKYDRVNTENIINSCLIGRVWEDGSLRGRDAETATDCLQNRGVYSEFLERFSD